ncbi:MAG TPA: hypothetical protein PLF32_00340 [Bacteroidales bacterium]|jgi:hypothetical protein|nr:hypothetical protein [Bacteroidales bacterium]HOF15324.1 hypothetical protein [Bacteroidales bacterium]HOR81088.1 hypothetical protein [Bacteroidales bacterium]HPJ91925.1 hypothetical protein [Bacteroidales bacterium]HPX59463.1 hypothetical protein [Bacteroidales bacterium]
MKKTFFLFVLTIIFIAPTYSQDINVGDAEILSVRKKEWDIYASMHTNGLGIGARIGKQHNIHYKSGIDIELTYYKHIKEQRARINYMIYDLENKSFVYGKLNYFIQPRVGYGFTRIINTKPYWGGISTGYFLYGGVSIGIAVPIYLQIIYIENSDYTIKTERYNPEIHDLSNIYSSASFTKGLAKTKIHPGLYLKTGFSFDFSSEDSHIMALDFGLNTDIYFPAVKLMASSNDKYFFITGFIAFHFGKRLTNYE